MIMEVIRELAKTKTVILISHRLANVVEADRIYMMKNGEFAELGVHDELMKLDGYYAQLFESQRVLEEYSKDGSEGHTKAEVNGTRGEGSGNANVGSNPGRKDSGNGSMRKEVAECVQK